VGYISFQNVKFFLREPSILHSENPQRNLPGRTGFDVIGHHMCIDLVAELQERFICPSDLKNVFVVCDKIA